MNRVRRANRFLSLGDIHSAIVFFLPQQYDAADAFIRQLRAMGKEVAGWIYMPKNYKDDFPETQYRVLEQKEDFDWTGEPWSETIDEFLEVSCDAVIDLTIEPCYSFLYLFIQKESVFKVGIGKEFAPCLYDLTITRVKGKDTAFFANQIIFYLESIRSS